MVSSLHWAKDWPPTGDDHADDDDDKNEQNNEGCDAEELADDGCHGVFGGLVVVVQDTWIVESEDWLTNPSQIESKNTITFNSGSIDHGTASVYWRLISWEVAVGIAEFLQEIPVATITAIQFFIDYVGAQIRHLVGAAVEGVLL